MISCTKILDILKLKNNPITTEEAYLEPSRTSTMKLFCKYSERLKAVNYFRKNAPL